MRKILILISCITTINSYTQNNRFETTTGQIIGLGGITIGGAYILANNHLDRAFDGHWTYHDTELSLLCGSIFMAMNMVDNRWNWNFSSGIDPRMLLLGSDVNPPSYDGLFRIYNSKYDLNYGVAMEVFDYIGYHSYSTFLSYQFYENNFDILGGIEYLRIDNQNKQVNSIGVNVEFRTDQSKKFSGFWICNYKYRPEISKFGVYSNYCGVIYNIK